VGAFNQNPIGGGTGFLGAVPPAVGFGDVVGGANFTLFGLTNSGDVLDGELLLSTGGPIYVLGGTSSWTDNGAADSVNFNLNVTTTAGGTANGTLNVSFNGDLISGGSGYSEANLDEFLNGDAFLSNFGSIVYTDISTANTNIYIGVAQAVPEPSAFSALALVGVAGMIRRRRK
jgi:hypothetical protein